jgi:hypothetical protein
MVVGRSQNKKEESVRRRVVSATPSHQNENDLVVTPSSFVTKGVLISEMTSFFFCRLEASQ